MADLAPDWAEAHAAEVEALRAEAQIPYRGLGPRDFFETSQAASDPSKADEAEQAVETAPSSLSNANDASANVRAEDVREDKDSPAASKGDGGLREEGSDSDALQLDGAGEVASALAAMMSAVGGLQKSIGSLEEVELPIDSAPLAVEEKDDRPAPGGVAEILAGLNAAMGPVREEAPATPAPAAEQELSLEELEDRVLLQKVLVKQLRSDYEARFERSQSLQQALDDLGTEPQELQDSCQFCHMAHDQEGKEAPAVARCRSEAPAAAGSGAAAGAAAVILLFGCASRACAGACDCRADHARRAQPATRTPPPVAPSPSEDDAFERREVLRDLASGGGGGGFAGSP
ncbi:unnamed protein product [Symbiodinium sp. CCMP2456]|nr:unnamed protein product [Symbiodinium sp. CCMP2456]